MGEELTDEKVRQVRVPDALFTRVVRAAAAEQAQTGKRVSTVGWIREAIELRLDEHEQPPAVVRIPPAGREAGR